MPNPFGYSDTLIDHFDHPRNAGELGDANAVGSAGDTNHEYTTFYLRVADDTITRVTFKCMGCPPAIAAASMTTELATGQHLDDAAEITGDAIVTALGGLPAEKRHVASMAAEALANAITNYIVDRIEEHS